MPLTRRSLLKGLIVGAAAVAGPLANSAIVRWWRSGRRGAPALVAGPDVGGTLVRLADVPSHAGDATLAYAAEPPSPTGQGEPGKRWVMVIALAKCDGCRECTRACQAMHLIPDGQEWIRVYEMRDHEAGAPYWLPRPCMQCDNPPCVKVCPVSAVWKRDDGIVMQDTARCIGCRFCMAACPYQARSFNWVDHTLPGQQPWESSMEWNRVHRRGTTEKCIFCPGLIKEGKLPACVAACPMGAIYFGDQVEDAVTNSQGETVRFSGLVEQGAGNRLMEDLGTEPRVYYLPPRKRLYHAPPASPEPMTTMEHH